MLLVMGLIGPVIAGAESTPTGLLTLSVANDSFFIQDRGYTSGLDLAFSPANTAYTLRIGQDIYTPDRRDSPQPPPGQHPYAAWLYGRYEHRLRVGSQLLVTPSLSIGTTGKRALGEAAQAFAHHVLGFSEYDGWDSQLTERWGWIATLNAQWRHALWQQQRYQLDGGVLLEGRGGTIQADVSFGVNFRFGYNLPPLQAILPAGQPALYLSVAAVRQWVDKNVFLEGFGRSDYHVDPQRIFDTLSCGIHWQGERYLCDLDLYFPEQQFRGQSYHCRYGMLRLGYRF